MTQAHTTQTDSAPTMPDERAPLEREIRRRIAIAGPMPVGQFMQLCLTHEDYGYYMTRDPLGTLGDFTTSPEISQMFGELVGLWAASVWRQMGTPDNVRVVELGPGRGSMMLDVLRAGHIVPAFRKAAMIHMVEISPALETRQRQALTGLELPVEWHRSLDEVPDGPTIILANEFFDSLPIQQAIMCADGWHERVVRIDDDDRFAFSHARDPIPLFNQMLPPAMREAQIGDIFEWRADQIALELGRRVARSQGAALVVDYGHVASALGDTLQAVRAHEFADPLAAPGEADLTAHLDFQALAQAVESMGARAYGPLEQAEFLHRLGIASRAEALKVAAPHKAEEIDAARERLTDEEATGMGRLFKAIAFGHHKLGKLPCF
jgi:NADH dehydrogenase [ubiquinone] 1 alpha subcomplex assembly factor 7